MANHKSAVKAHQQSLVRRERNRELRSRMRRSLRSLRAAMAGGEDVGSDTVRQTFSLIDRLVSKGIIHANTAARHKSRLTRRLQKGSAPA